MIGTRSCLLSRLFVPMGLRITSVFVPGIEMPGYFHKFLTGQDRRQTGDSKVFNTATDLTTMKTQAAKMSISITG